MINASWIFPPILPSRIAIGYKNYHVAYVISQSTSKVALAEDDAAPPERRGTAADKIKTCPLNSQVCNWSVTIVKSLHDEDFVWTSGAATVVSEYLVSYCLRQRFSSRTSYRAWGQSEPHQQLELQLFLCSTPLLCFSVWTIATMAKHLLSEWSYYRSVWDPAVHEAVSRTERCRTTTQPRMDCFWYVSLSKLGRFKLPC